MFNPAIFFKTVRDSAATLILAMIGLIAFQIVFVWAMLNMGTDLLAFVAKVPFLVKIFEVGFGIKVDGEISLNVLFAVCFTHAVVLSIVWGVMIAISTRTTVGEVERGTADILLTLPVSRAEVFFSTSVVWFLAAGLLAACPIIGIWLALQIFSPEEAVDLQRYIKPAVNFFFANVAVASLSIMVSSFLDRRSIAIGTVTAICLISVVLQFVEPFLETMQQVRFFGFLNYYRPVDVVRTGEWPVTNMICLAGFAFFCWLIGLIRFSTRDIPTA